MPVTAWHIGQHTLNLQWNEMWMTPIYKLITRKTWSLLNAVTFCCVRSLLVCSVAFKCREECWPFQLLLVKCADQTN